MKFTPGILKGINESKVSNEGILDSFVALVKGHKRNSPGDQNNGKKIQDWEWVRKQRAEIEKTFGNPGWVKSNYHPMKGSLSEKQKLDLSYKGKILLPSEGLKKGVEMVDSFLDALREPLTKYSNTLEQIESDSEKAVASGKDSKVVAKEALAKLKKVAPFNRTFTSDEFLGGLVVTLGKPVKPNHKLSEVPELTEEEIIAAGALLAKLDVITDRWFKVAVQAGSECTSDLWDTEGFNYDSDTGEQIQDLIYFQQRPDDYVDLQYGPIFKFTEYARDVGRWLQAYTR